ncbi:hypothetical protein [Streptomyces sp. NPDC002851]
MIRSTSLRPEDRGDFELVLHLALDAADIRDLLPPEPSAPTLAQVRSRALAAADEITAAAQSEYRAYLRARAATAAQPASSEPLTRPPTTWGAWCGPRPGVALLPALAVLAPLISAAAAAILLLLGYALRLTGAEADLAAPLITAGWISAALAAAGAVIGVTALLLSAQRRRTTDSTTRIRLYTADAEQAREAWRQALLERGMLPYLRTALADHRTTHAGNDTPPASD